MLNQLISKIARILTILGAVNWGAALFDQNLVTMLFGSLPIVVKIVYGLIGTSGVVELLNFFGLNRD